SGTRPRPPVALDARTVGRRRTPGAARPRDRTRAPPRSTARVHILLAQRRLVCAKLRRRLPRLPAIRYAGRRGGRSRGAEPDGISILETRRLAGAHAGGQGARHTPRSDQRHAFPRFVTALAGSVGAIARGIC